MTDERLSLLRQAVEIQTLPGMMVMGKTFALLMTECLDEIESLRRALRAAMFEGLDDTKGFYGPP